MATAVIMPKFGFTMESGTIINWYKHEGEHVEEGEPLVEVTTDKVNMDIESPASGTVRGICAQPDDVVPVTQVIAYITAEGEALPTAEPAVPAAPAASTAAPASTSQPATASTTPTSKGPVAATPVARRMAKALGLDIERITGSGPHGRVMEDDVRRYAEQQNSTTAVETVSLSDAKPGVSMTAKASDKLTASATASTTGLSAASKPGAPVLPSTAAEPARPATTDATAATPSASLDETVLLTGRRKLIAERMSQSKRESPHITLTVEVDMSAAERKRGMASFTAYIAFHLSPLLRKHRFMNASLRGQEIVLHEQVNLGIAVDTEAGLIVPVVPDADRRSLAELDSFIGDLSRRARGSKLVLADVSGGTFTISNLGMFGITEFEAIINPPECAILAVGAIVRRPVAVGDLIGLRPIMKLTLSADHRVIDGAMAARFLQDVRTTLEQ